MAVKVNDEQLAKQDAEKEEYVPETKFIEAGSHPAVLVGYNELGKHYPIFNGRRNVFDSGKNRGKEKPAELIINIVFEFPTCDFDNVPLTIETSIPYGKLGEFINKLPVSDALAEGTGCTHDGLDDHIGSKFLIAVTNVPGKVDPETKIARMYSNMKPEGITKPSFRHPVTKKVEEIDVPDAKGTYGPVFDWDTPTIEAWAALKKNIKGCIKRAVNFDGSPIQALLADMPEESSEAVPDQDAMPENTPPVETGKAAVAADDDIPV